VSSGNLTLLEGYAGRAGSGGGHGERERDHGVRERGDRPGGGELVDDHVAGDTIKVYGDPSATLLGSGNNTITIETGGVAFLTDESASGTASTSAAAAPV